jgi:hypothetical protein
MAVAAAIALLAAASFLAAAAAPVPAIYVLGDSLADVGNNNHLPTILRADFPHNGIDFPGRKATGRFSNGKNSVDFLGACRVRIYSSMHLARSGTTTLAAVESIDDVFNCSLFQVLVGSSLARSVLLHLLVLFYGPIHSISRCSIYIHVLILCIEICLVPVSYLKL